MFLFLAILATFSAITMLAAGGLSLLRNPSKIEHQWFFALTLALFFWVPANFFDSNIARPIITSILVKIDYSLALLIAWLLLQFVCALTRSSTYKNSKIKYYYANKRNFRIGSAVANCIMIAAIASNLVFHVSVRAGSLKITSTHLALIYIVMIASYFIYALSILGQAYLKSPINKRQGLNIIWVGFFIAIIANVASNLVFPSLIEHRAVVEELNIIGYVGLLLLVGCVYFAITTKKLFDIRLVVARSLAYALLVIFLGATYTGLITLTSFLFVSGSRLSTLFVVSNLILTLFAALTFQYVRDFLNRLTSRVFFRDVYNTQDVINDINVITTSTIDLNMLLHDSSTLLAHVMKGSYCTYVIAGKNDDYRLVGTTGTPHELAKYSNSVLGILRPHTPVILEDLESHETWKTQLDHLQTELFIPLYTNQTLIGFMAFGTKQNGVVYTPQDINLLSLVADNLAVAIQNALRFEEIENFNITLQQKVTDATHRLANANKRLVALDETKDDFISMASHQLRTPLTSVKGYLSLVLEGDAGKITPLQRKMLSQAFTSSQHMVYLIADLLNVSRLKTGKFVIDPIKSNMADVVKEEIDQLTEVLDSHSLTMVYNRPPGFPDLMLDETKTRQVIMNFIDNAIYYTPAGGVVTVELLDKPSSVELRVVDNGIGVPKSEQHHLFTKFYRAGNARKARPDGTGLGLFMAKKVVIAQGGAIIFESSEGKGSVFGFSLPKATHKVLDQDAAASPTQGAAKSVPSIASGVKNVSR
jgi:signal transduction histidine kinase